MSASERPIQVGQDLDGVWYRFDESFTAYLLSTGYDPAKIVEVTNWHFYRDFGLSDAEFIAACHAGVDAGTLFAVGEPYDGALDAAQRIADAGCDIHVVTDRSFGAAKGASLDATVKWIEHYGFPCDSVTISADKTVVEADFFFEDRLENYDALDAAGVQVYLINRPWNTLHGPDERRRVDTHAQFADIVCAAAAERSGGAPER